VSGIFTSLLLIEYITTSYIPIHTDILYLPRRLTRELRNHSRLHHIEIRNIRVIAPDHIVVFLGPRDVCRVEDSHLPVEDSHLPV